MTWIHLFGIVDPSRKRNPGHSLGCFHDMIGNVFPVHAWYIILNNYQCSFKLHFRLGWMHVHSDISESRPVFHLIWQNISQIGLQVQMLVISVVNVDSKMWWCEHMYVHACGQKKFKYCWHAVWMCKAQWVHFLWTIALYKMYIFIIIKTKLVFVNEVYY